VPMMDVNKIKEELKRKRLAVVNVPDGDVQVVADVLYGELCGSEVCDFVYIDSGRNILKYNMDQNMGNLSALIVLKMLLNIGLDGVERLLEAAKSRAVIAAGGSAVYVLVMRGVVKRVVVSAN